MLRADDLMRVREGSLSFDAFVRVARPDFMKLAQKLTVSPPAWLDVEDVAQEMLLSVPRSIARWREGDYPIKRFVVFRACSAARKYIKRGRAYSSFEARTARLEEALPATQEQTVEDQQRMLELLVTIPTTPLQHAVMSSLMRTQSVDRTVQDLIKDPRTRVMFAADDDLVRLRVRRVMAILADSADQVRRAQGQG